MVGLELKKGKLLSVLMGLQLRRMQVLGTWSSGTKIKIFMLRKGNSKRRIRETDIKMDLEVTTEEELE